MSWSLSERLYLYCICNVLLHLSAMIVGCTWVQVPAGVDVSQNASGVCLPSRHPRFLHSVHLQHGAQPGPP